MTSHQANGPISVEGYGVAVGASSSDPFITVFATRDPNANDFNYPVKKRWINTAKPTEWILQSFSNVTGQTLANWIELSNGSAILTISGDDGVIVDPDTNGNISIEGLVVANSTHSKAVYTESPSANTEKIDVQVSAAIASTNIAKVGLSAFNNTQFSVDANGFVSSLGNLYTLSDNATPTITVIPSSSGASPPNNIQLTGQVFETSANFNTVVSSPGTNSITINPMSPARWIVDASGTNGTHTTIASALTSARSGDTIVILPKLGGAVYTENLSLKNGINLTALGNDSLTPNVVINGQLTMPSAGTCTISGISLQTNGAPFLSLTVASTTVNFNECNFNVTGGSTGMSLSSSAAANCYRCTGNVTAGFSLFQSSSSQGVVFRWCTMDGITTTASNASAGTFYAFYSNFTIPITTSGTASFLMIDVAITTTFQNVTSFVHGGSGADASATRCSFSGGSSVALTIGAGASMQALNCVVGSTSGTAIDGAGTLYYTPFHYTSFSSINITTATPITNQYGPIISLAQLSGPGGASMMCGAGDPNATITATKGSLYLRTDGSSTTTRAYINTDGATAWTSVTTAT
jgi:hypothetical protein